MENKKPIFIASLIIIITILLGFFQQTIFIKRLNDGIKLNIDSIEKQIISFETRNNSERWNVRIATLTNSNKELKNKIAVLEAILTQEAIKLESGKAKETPKKIKLESDKAKGAPEGNKGFLYKKR